MVPGPGSAQKGVVHLPGAPVQEASPAGLSWGAGGQACQPLKIPALGGCIITAERDAVYEVPCTSDHSPQTSGGGQGQLAGRQVAFCNKTRVAQEPHPQRQAVPVGVPLGYLVNPGFSKPQLSVPRADKGEKPTARPSLPLVSSQARGPTCRRCPSTNLIRLASALWQAVGMPFCFALTQIN